MDVFFSSSARRRAVGKWGFCGALAALMGISALGWNLLDLIKVSPIDRYYPVRAAVAAELPVFALYGYVGLFFCAGGLIAGGAVLVRSTGAALVAAALTLTGLLGAGTLLIAVHSELAVRTVRALANSASLTLTVSSGPILLGVVGALQTAAAVAALWYARVATGLVLADDAELFLPDDAPDDAADDAAKFAPDDAADDAAPLPTRGGDLRNSAQVLPFPPPQNPPDDVKQ